MITPLLIHFAQATANNCPTDPTGSICQTGLPTVAASADTVKIVLQLVFAVIGSLTLFIIILSGLKFITAQGNPQSIAQARKTIIYAVIGLVFAVSAEAIVTFVIGRL